MIKLMSKYNGLGIIYTLILPVLVISLKLNSILILILSILSTYILIKKKKINKFY